MSHHPPSAQSFFPSQQRKGSHVSRICTLQQIGPVNLVARHDFHHSLHSFVAAAPSYSGDGDGGGGGGGGDGGGGGEGDVEEAACLPLLTLSVPFCSNIDMFVSIADPSGAEDARAAAVPRKSINNSYDSRSVCRSLSLSLSLFLV